MKRLVLVAVLTVFCLGALDSSPRSSEPHFVVVARPSANGVQLECLKGCRWKKLQAACGETPCQFTIDELGVRDAK
jgi:hypothetical protein